MQRPGNIGLIGTRHLSHQLFSARLLGPQYTVAIMGASIVALALIIGARVQPLRDLA